MKSIKKSILLWLLLFVCFSFSSCYTLSSTFRLSKPKDVYDNFCVTPTDKKITLEKAKELYISNKIGDIVYPPHSYEIPQYLKYAHTLEQGEFYDCYIFDIDEKDKLKFYVYMTKMIDYYDSVAEPVLIQTVFVDKSISEPVYEYELGDNLQKVTEHNPNLQLLENNIVINFGSRYFEFVDENFVYCYTINETGNIVTKHKSDLIEIQNIYTPKE